MGCIVSALACCCCSTAASCCCACLPSCKSSTSSRIMYSIIILLGGILSCISLAPGFTKFLQKIPALCSPFKIPGFDTKLNSGFDCSIIVGYQAVYRIGLALTMFYTFFCVLMLCVSSSRDPRSKIQNGFWCLKFLLFIACLIGSFYIDIRYMNFRWMVVCMVGAFIFVLVEMIFLIDFGYAWNGSWLGKYQSNNSHIHYCGLLIFTIFFYLVAMASAVLLFVLYTTPNGCTSNKFFIGFNLGLCILISIISLLPKVQEVQPNSGILQASLISMFIMYLTWMAMTSGTEMACNPELRSLVNSTSVTSTTSIDIFKSRFDIVSGTSIIIFFFFILFTAFQGSSHTSIGKLMMSSNSESALLNGPTTAADAENQMGQKVWDDEEDQVSYSYSRLHFIYILASLYITMILTNWYVPNAKNYLEPNSAGVWVKIASSWICVLLYIWTLVAPVVLPNRDFS